MDIKNIAGFWSNATDLVAGLDDKYYWMHIVLVALMMTVIIPMVYFLFRYSAKNNPPEKAETLEHHTALEIAWTVIPTIVVLVCFWWGYTTLEQLRTMPKDAMHVKVIGKKWNWSYEYDNGKKTSKLYVPKGQNVVLDMHALTADVIHSFWIPSFRVKEDVVPGRTSHLWFNANQAGSYDVECAEYCGDLHAKMLSKVVVMEPAEYDNWYGKVEKLDGAKIAQREGCLNCHSTAAGVTIVGPSLAGVTAGKSHAYLKDALVAPDKDIATGFFPGVMPKFDALTSDEVNAVIDYLKTIK